MIRFGPAGNSESFYAQGYKSTYEQMKWLSELGLDAYEYSFGRGVRISADAAAKIGGEARLYDIALSCHAPYYINLVTDDGEKMGKNDGYILSTCIAAQNMGADRIVVHPGSCTGIDRAVALEWVRAGILRALEELEKRGLDGITLCIETMGKQNQFGTLEEVLSLCRDIPQILPAIDFGHIYARTLGGITGYDDYAAMLSLAQETIGDRAGRMHVHFSKIEFTGMGEKRHLTFESREFGPDPEPLMRLFHERNMQPRVICESNGTMAEDALYMKKTYEEIRKNG